MMDHWWDYIGIASETDWERQSEMIDEMYDWENLCEAAEVVWSKNDYYSHAFGPVMSVEPIGMPG